MFLLGLRAAVAGVREEISQKKIFSGPREANRKQNSAFLGSRFPPREAH